MGDELHSLFAVPAQPYRAVSREEAAEMTGGILPETLFRQYLDILRDNRGEK